MNNSLDDKIGDIFKKNRNKDIPIGTQRIINQTLENIEHRKRENKYIQKLIAGCAVFLLTCSAVFASELQGLIKNIFKYDYNGNQGIQVAVDKGYVQNVDMDYIECNDTKFKIDYVTMDDSILAINFNFLLSESAEKFKGISFYNMKIFDDNRNIIYEETEKFPNDGLSLGIGTCKPIFISGNNLIESFLIESDRFPKTKTIRITFEKITLYNENYGNPITKEINGQFDIELELDKKFYNRETKEYNIESCESDGGIQLSKVFLTDTSLNFIVNNAKLNELCIELKDEAGNILYYGENIYLKEINDDTKRKIAKIEITKYEEMGEILRLTIKAKNKSKEIGDIYLYNSEEENVRTYNIEETINSQNNNTSVIISDYILKSSE